MKPTTKVPIDIARRGDDRAREIFDAAANFGKTFNECLGEVYMTGIMAGAASEKVDEPCEVCGVPMPHIHAGCID
jgi:hypothetical protein